MVGMLLPFVLPTGSGADGAFMLVRLLLSFLLANSRSADCSFDMLVRLLLFAFLLGSSWKSAT
eukprot:CAMPEP_0206519166 /NCGR_PEP_ID=MMETSP0324_2-20121206/65011_1 /ASSEMBLY_ACC=CAM_ASM_000836 /TAXON_ID=2866 /ORGANISM="Crypthecodinium cohnii, Strain Seligo" /LENGTH=62 /DNA_ID=CAMNT_0054012659 /DNA_START=103 /DNA_END=287 /DNA_ORIENTATION=+